MAKKTVYLNPAEFGVGLNGTDNNNCSVRALANATDKPISECYAMLSKHGRERHEGVHSHITYPAYKEAGLEWIGYFGKTKEAYACAYWGCKAPNITVMRRFQGCTLGTFLKLYSKGSFVVNIAGHVLCIKNGAIIDSHANKSTATVFAAWEVK